MLKRLIGENVRLELALRAGGKIRVDSGNFEQVVVNLVVNARDAIRGVGTIRLSTRQERIDPNSNGAEYAAFQAGEYYVVEVCDTGSGMSEEVMSHLFEPFFTTKEKGHGTGLGLSTSYGIVKQNRGEILVHSKVGEGSTFRVYLPTVADAIERKPASRPSEAFGGKEIILLTEDEDGVRTVATQMLRNGGYTVVTASSGAAGLEAAAAMERIDLLITDMVMGGMSGRELADQLRARRPGLPVLFVSGYVDSGIVHDGVIEADAAFLHKPFSSDDLVKKVREVLDSQPRAH
jgi:CheY-like chemotaxis protein